MRSEKERARALEAACSPSDSKPQIAASREELLAGWHAAVWGPEAKARYLPCSLQHVVLVCCKCWLTLQELVKDAQMVAALKLFGSFAQQRILMAHKLFVAKVVKLKALHGRAASVLHQALSING